MPIHLRSSPPRGNVFKVAPLGAFYQLTLRNNPQDPARTKESFFCGLAASRVGKTFFSGDGGDTSDHLLRRREQALTKKCAPFCGCFGVVNDFSGFVYIDFVCLLANLVLLRNINTSFSLFFSACRAVGALAEKVKQRRQSSCSPVRQRPKNILHCCSPTVEPWARHISSSSSRNTSLVTPNISSKCCGRRGSLCGINTFHACVFIERALEHGTVYIVQQSSRVGLQTKEHEQFLRSENVWMQNGAQNWISLEQLWSLEWYPISSCRPQCFHKFSW